MTVTTAETDERPLLDEPFTATVVGSRITVFTEYLLRNYSLEQIGHEYACRFLGFGTFELVIEGSGMFKHGT